MVDVAIMGAGVLGSAVAYTLSGSTNLRIVVIEHCLVHMAYGRWHLRCAE